MIEIILNSFLLVFVGEIGDKTQLLAIVLTTRFRKPWTIMLGILVATLLNHALAAWAGAWVGSLVTPEVLKWVLALAFIGFGLWMLIPDDEGQVRSGSHLGVFTATVISFFIAEMGDKTQLATIALAARYSDVLLVTIGTTLGMMASNAMAVLFGEKLLTKIPMKSIRILACVLFVISGIVIAVGQ